MKRFWFSFALAAAAVLGTYAVASAHVRLVSSDPAANSALAATPTRIRLEFSEAVAAAVAKISIVRADSSRVELILSNDSANAKVLLAPVENLGPGTFRVVWRIVSRDGHPTTGSFAFSVNAAAPVAPAEHEHAGHEQPAPTKEETAPTNWGPTILGAPTIPAVLRGLGVGSLAALAGLLFFAVSVGAERNDSPIRVALWLSVAAVVLLGGHLAAWLVNTAPDHRPTAEWIGATLGTAAGRTELWRSLLVLPPLWALALTRRPGVALLFAIPPLFLSAAIGHSTVFTPMWSIPMKALHLVAVSAWLGGLLWLIVREPTDVLRFAQETMRVSTVALTAVVTIALSGIVQTLLIIPSFSDLRSAYGAVVMLKIAGLGGLMAFGAYHRFRVMPRLAMGMDGSVITDFSASLRREVALLWLVAVLGGLLAYVSPPMPS